MNSRILDLILVNSIRLIKIFLQVIVILHSLFNILFNPFIPEFYVILIRVTLRMYYWQLLSRSPAIIYLVTKLPKCLYSLIKLKLFVETLLIQNLDKIKFTRLSRTHYHNIEIIHFDFSFYVLLKKCVIRKIRFFQKSI